MNYTRRELRRMPVDQLMVEVAKRVRKVQGLERVCTKTVPNTERIDSNGLVWITGTVYGYAEERMREDKKVFPWLRGMNNDT